MTGDDRLAARLAEMGVVSEEGLRRARVRRDSSIRRGQPIDLGQAIVECGLMEARSLAEFRQRVLGEADWLTDDDRETLSDLRRRPTLDDERIEQILADAGSDRGRGLVLPLVTYAVRRGYLTASDLAADRPASTDEGGGLEPGATFAGFEIVEELGRGVSGIVFRARSFETGHSVALKILRREGDRVLARRFEREARLLARLEHANIIGIQGAGVEDGYHYLALDLIEGSTLADRLSAGPLEPAEALPLFVSILSALECAHRRGIVHRDLKPANVLLDGDGRPIVTDFGLARRLQDEGQLTRTEAAIGTPYYMSPEQARQGRRAVGPASDLYAVGVMLYQALAGQRPFAAGSAAELFTRIETERPPPLTDPALDLVCRVALMPDPADRFPDAAAFAADLGRYLEGRPVRARAPGPAGRLWRRIRRSPRASVAVGAAVLLAVAGLAFLAATARSRAAEGPPEAALELSASRAREAVERGQRHLDAGRLDEAIADFEEALAGSPGDAEAVCGLARCLVGQGRLDEADALLAAAGDEGRVALLRIELAIDRARDAEGLATAVVRLEDLGRRMPGDPAVHRLLARALRRLGRAEEATFHERRSVDLEERAMGEALAAARALADAGRILEALAALEPFAQQDAPRLPVEELRARLLVDHGSLPRALAAAARCVEAEPSSSTYRLLRARVLVALGRFAAAAGDLARLPDDPWLGEETALLRGRVAEGLGHRAEAVERYDRVLEGTWVDGRAGRRADVHLRRGRLRVELGDPSRAASDFDAVVRLEPDRTEARFLRAVAAIETGSGLEAAGEDLERAVAGGYRPVWRVHVERSRLALALGRAEEALDALGQVPAEGREAADYRFVRADVLLALDRADEALAEAEEAVRSDPYRARSYRMRGRALLALERHVAAEASFRQALRIEPGDVDSILFLFECAGGRADYDAAIEILQAVAGAMGSSPGPRDELFEIDSTALGDLDPARAEAPAEALDLEDHLWALGHRDPTVREAALTELSLPSPGRLSELRRRRAEAPAELGRAIDGAIARMEEVRRRRERRAVIPVLARAFLALEPDRLESWLAGRADGVEVLAAILADGEESTDARRLAARALMASRSGPGFDALRGFLDDPDPVAAAVAATALVEGGHRVAPAAVDRLLAAEQAVARGMAVTVLPPGDERLRAALADEDASVRLLAAARIGPDSEARDRAAEVLRSALDDGSAVVRLFALRALEPLVDGPGALGATIRRLADEDGLVRREAAALLGRVLAGRPRGAAGPALHARFEIEERPDVRAALLFTMASMGYDRADELIEPLLFDRSAHLLVRFGAFLCAMQQGGGHGRGRGGMTRFMKLLEPEEHWLFRVQFLFLLGSSARAPMIQGMLLGRLEAAPPRDRIAILLGLHLHEGEAVSRAIEAHLSDVDLSVRRVALGARVLRTALGLDVDPGLEERLRTEDRATRAAAVALLGRIGGRRVRVRPDGDSPPGAGPTGRRPPGGGPIARLTAEDRLGLVQLAARIEPEEPDWIRRQVELLVQLDRVDEAPPILEAAVERLPEATALLRWRAELDLRSGRVERAVADLERCVAVRPDQADAWRVLGEARRALGRSGPAGDAFRMAWRIEPGHRASHEALVASHLEAGDPGPVVAVVEEAVVRWPTDAGVHWLRALVQGAAGDDAGALASLLEAARLGHEGLAEARDRPEFERIRESPAFRALVGEPR